MCVHVCMCVCEKETHRLWYIPLESLWLRQQSFNCSLAVSIWQVASAMLQVTAVLQEVANDRSIGPGVLSVHT